MRRRDLFGMPLLFAPAAAQAAWPERPVTIVTGFGAGGSSDIAARILAEKLTETLGQRVLVENRPGAGGTVAAEHVRRLPPDGQVLMISDPSGLVIAPLVNDTVRYRATEDFDALSILGASPMVLLVRREAPYEDIAALVAALRAAPGGLDYASSGIGATPHLAAELFLQRAGVAATHVPYRSGAQMNEAMLRGDTAFGFAVLASSVGQIREGLFRALAVSTQAPHPSLPSVPPLAATYPGFDFATWYVLIAPRGLSPAVTATLAQRIPEALADPNVRQRLAAAGLEPVDAVRPPEAAAFLAAETQKIGAIVAAAGARMRG